MNSLAHADIVFKLMPAYWKTSVLIDLSQVVGVKLGSRPACKLI